MSSLRVAVIGAGHLGRIHARLLSTQDDVQLVGVTDPLIEKAKAVAGEFQTAAFSDHRRIQDKIDAAVVATPTALHHDVTVELLGRGVHVLVEKPIAGTVDEADRMVTAAVKNRRVLQVGHVERFNPALSAVRDQLQQPKFIEAVRASGYTFRSTDVGVVLDLMIHDLDLVLSLVQSDIIDVEALGVSVFGGHEDIAHARLRFANGCVANLNASRASFQAQRSMQVFCQRAYASVDFATGEAKLVRPSDALLHRQLGFESLSLHQQEEMKPRIFEDVLQFEQVTAPKSNAILDEQRDFVAAIQDGRPVRVPGQQGRAALDAAHRILAKIETHAWSEDSNGPVGPMATPVPTLLRTPHWSPAGASTQPQRKAG